jgi:DNA-binding response OmpR family regulator
MACITPATKCHEASCSRNSLQRGLFLLENTVDPGKFERTMTPASQTILIVEDDPDIRRLVGDVLEREGFAVETARDGAAMDGVLMRLRPDLLILDLMLPGEDGLSICRRIRLQDHLPILMLTARSDEIDKVLGLEMGADDYLVKPFGTRELVARVRALLRRGSRGAEPQTSRRFAFDRLIVDLDTRQVSDLEGTAISLTSTEFDLLTCFIQRPRRVLKRDQILDWVHGRDHDPFDRSVDMLVSRLRRKLDAASPGAGLISTVRNGGYLFTAQVRRVP